MGNSALRRIRKQRESAPQPDLGEVDARRDCASTSPQVSLSEPRARLKGMLVMARSGGACDGASAEAAIRRRLAKALAAIDCVAANAAAARAAIATCVVHQISDADLEPASVDLAAAIERAAALKTVAFESEATALETLLDQTAPVLDSAIATALDAGASDAALVLAIAALATHLPFLCAPGPTELDALFIVPDSPLVGCRLASPVALRHSDVALLAANVRARLGSTVEIMVVKRADAAMHPAETERVLAHLGSQICVVSSLQLADQGRPECDDAVVPLAARVVATASALVIQVSIPPTLPDGPLSAAIEAGSPARLHVDASLEGLCIVAASGPGTLRFPFVRGGMCPPLRLTLGPGRSARTHPHPAISRDGRLFIPTSTAVACWAATGEPLPPIIHILNHLLCVAVDDVSRTLLLGGDGIVALDLGDPDAPPRWVSDFGPGWAGGSVVPLPGQRLVVVTPGMTDKEGVLLRVSDGRRVGSCGFCGNCTATVADVAAARLFTADNAGGMETHRWVANPYAASWGPGCGAGSFVREVVPLFGARLAVLAFIPASAASATPACLVGSDRGSSELTVVSLPDYRVLHRHYIGVVAVRGLAGDPSGGALAVCVSDGGVIVLPWPLPGSGMGGA